MTDRPADPPVPPPAEPQPHQPSAAEVRAARLRVALRDNLARRKAQGRARTARSGTESED